MDKVFIRRLKADAVIGVFDWEREIRQPLYIDLDLATDISRAAASDDLADTLDYKAISEFVQAFIADSQYQLIETLAEALAASIRERFAVSWLRMVVHKPGALADAEDLGIEIERGSK